MMSVTLERPLTRDRAIVVAVLVALVVVSWVYLWRHAAAMSAMEGDHARMAMAMPSTEPWTLAEFTALAVMWIVMMVGMMVPSAAPMVLLFSRLARKDPAPTALSRTGFFLLAYLAMWSAFSVLAAGAQWVLHDLALLSPMMVSTSPFLGGALLLATGVFQWTPLKRACLRGCRSPLGFLIGEWRDGPRGAVVMGLRHGALCLGCCWALMALLFVVGVMNLVWIATIAGFVLAEKALPDGERLGRIGGVLLVIAGVVVAGGPWQ